MAEIISVLILVTVLGVVCLIYREEGRGNGKD
jgi:hypothetical protein